MKLAAAFALLLILARSASAAAPEIAVDPRLELLGVVQRLAGQERFPTDDAAYAKAVDEHFAAFRSHPVVRLYAELSKGPGDPLGVILLYYTNPPELALKDPSSTVPFADTEDGGEKVLSFVWQLRDFAAKSGFADFYKANAARYAAAEKDARSQLGKLDPDAAIAKYTGIDVQARRHYALSLLYSPRHNDSFIIPYPDVGLLGRHDGPFDVWTMFQYFSGQESRDRSDFSPFRVPSPQLWQESVYVIVEPAVYYFEHLRPFDAGAYYGAGAAACRSRDVNCVKSAVVAALLDRMGAGGPRMPESPDYGSALRTRLQEYEANRSKYPTLWDFLPRLLSVYSEMATGRPAPNPVEGLKIPSPRKTSDFFSPAMLALLPERK